MSDATGVVTRLSGPSDAAPLLCRCPMRYFLSDDLTRVCTELAYSKGAQVWEFMDLIRIPSELVWIEWCEAPWRETLQEHGLGPPEDAEKVSGRRGVLVRSFWSSGDADQDIFAGAMFTNRTTTGSCSAVPRARLPLPFPYCWRSFCCLQHILGCRSGSRTLHD